VVVRDREQTAREATVPEAARGDVDPRIMQANERTLLAWLRTGIGLMAFGFVLARAGDWLAHFARGAPPAHAEFDVVPWLGIGLVALGVLFSALAGVEYARIRRALLRGLPISLGGVLPGLLAGLVSLIGITVLAVLIWRLLA
jgi:putative membrane protein